MATDVVGAWNPAAWVEGNYATYPQLPVGVAHYAAGMAWTISAPGHAFDTDFEVGDLAFVTQGPGRLYGDGLYGDMVYGGFVDDVWTVEVVTFVRWDSTPTPPNLWPQPYAGCPFTRDDLPGGDWAHGWRIVVDCYGPPPAGSRTYGQGNYGDGVYGDDLGIGVTAWQDITRPHFRITTGDGNADGAPTVVVSEMVVELVDEDGTYYDLAEPETWYQPQAGQALRVGFLDPSFGYWPVFSGQIERIDDLHDGDHPRTVSVRAFGRVIDLAVDVAQVQLPVQLASARLTQLATLAGWYWDAAAVTIPSGDTYLLGDSAPRDIVVRDEIDRTVQSCGWFFDTDRSGRMRVRTWPHEPTGTPLVITDCDPAVGLVSHAIAYVNDQRLLLNHAVTTNTLGQSVTVTDEISVSVNNGKRGRSFGFPKMGLAWAFPDVTRRIMQRVVDRFSRITRRVESLAFDTDVDPRWLATFAELNTGQAVTVQRAGIRPLELDAVVVGWSVEIEPGHLTGTLSTSTTTPSY